MRRGDADRGDTDRGRGISSSPSSLLMSLQARGEQSPAAPTLARLATGATMTDAVAAAAAVVPAAAPVAVTPALEWRRGDTVLEVDAGDARLPVADPVGDPGAAATVAGPAAASPVN